MVEAASAGVDDIVKPRANEAIAKTDAFSQSRAPDRLSLSVSAVNPDLFTRRVGNRCAHRRQLALYQTEATLGSEPELLPAVAPEVEPDSRSPG